MSVIDDKKRMVGMFSLGISHTAHQSCRFAK